jgi:molybdate transport system ATP-binding protein
MDHNPAINFGDSHHTLETISAAASARGEVVTAAGNSSKIPGMMDALVRLRGGSGRFEGSWTVRRGQQWVVMGPNGAGKTFLALLISGAIPPIGMELTVAEEIEPNVGLVTFSQQELLALKSWLQARWHSGIDTPSETVREYLSYEAVHDINPFEVRAHDAAERRAFSSKRSKTAALLGLTPLLKQPILRLSNGETRKLLLARALLKSPALLILDDPFAGLDAGARETLHQIITALAADGLPMIVTVRRPDEIPPSTTHILSLKRMRIAGRRRHAPAKIPAASDAGIADNDPSGETDAHEESVVQLRNVTIRYGRRVVIDRLSWTVRRGEKWLLKGPNGSGKTTLLSLITGDHPGAYAHDIRVFGRPRRPGESVFEIRRRIGHVSPEIQCHFDTRRTSLDAALSGRVGKYGGHVPIRRADRQSAAELLARMGLSAEIHTPLYQLSPGQMRLVLIARALLPEPELLLLDEPCLNLDTASRRLVLEMLARLLKTNKTQSVILTAHHPGDVPRGIRHILSL